MQYWRWTISIVWRSIRNEAQWVLRISVWEKVERSTGTNIDSSVIHRWKLVDNGHAPYTLWLFGEQRYTFIPPLYSFSYGKRYGLHFGQRVSYGLTMARSSASTFHRNNVSVWDWYMTASLKALISWTIIRWRFTHSRVACTWRLRTRWASRES